MIHRRASSRHLHEAPPIATGPLALFKFVHQHNIDRVAYEIEPVQLESQLTAVVRDHLSVEQLPSFLRQVFGEILSALKDQHLSATGPPFARYRPFDHGFDVEAGFPVSGTVASTGRVLPSQLPGGPVAQVLHQGDYSAIGAAYDAASEWAATRGYVLSEGAWESYLDGPEVAEPRTVVRLPYRREEQQQRG